MPKKSEGLEAWKKRKRDFRESGLSRRAYCQKVGIKESTLDYWFSRIRKLDKKDGFVEVHPTSVHQPHADLIVTTGKYRVEVSGSTGVAMLRETLNALESMK